MKTNQTPTTRYTFSPCRILVPLGAALAAVFCAEAEILLRVQPAMTDEMTVDVVMSCGSDLPATVVLYLVVTNEPKPFLDSDANPSHRSLDPDFLLAPEHVGKGYVLETYQDLPARMDADSGRFIAAIYNADRVTTLRPGLLMSLRFPPENKMNGLSVIVKDSVPAGMPGERIPASSASTAAGTEITVRSISGDIPDPDPCPTPTPPRNVHASNLYWGSIRLRWQAPSDAYDLEYRVYRADAPDSDLATPLQDAWQPGLHYRDMTVPRRGDSDWTGTRTYYYWIKARRPHTLCESDFSAPAARGAMLRAWLPTLSCTN